MDLIILEKVFDELLQVESHVEVVTAQSWLDVQSISDLTLFRRLLDTLDP